MLTSIDLRSLERQTVLVRSAADGHNPPVGRRGWIHVVDTGESGREPKVELIVEYPDMFNEPAHERIFVLRDDELATLLASERNGAYEFTLDTPLEG